MATVVPPTAATPPASKPAATQPGKVDYLDLPCPIHFEEIHSEALSCIFTVRPTYPESAKERVSVCKLIRSKKGKKGLRLITYFSIKAWHRAF